jgi:hypothetical protein
MVAQPSSLPATTAGEGLPWRGVATNRIPLPFHCAESNRPVTVDPSHPKRLQGIPCGKYSMPPTL